MRSGGRYWDQKLGEITFHFDSAYNQGVIFGRSLALVHGEAAVLTSLGMPSWTAIRTTSAEDRR